MSFSETGSKKKCLFLTLGWGGGVQWYSDMQLVYTGFKNGGLRERPLTENGGGQSGAGRAGPGSFRVATHWKNRILELTITKKRNCF